MFLDTEAKKEALRYIQNCQTAVRNCSVSTESDEAPTIVFISKMTPVKMAELSLEDAANIRAQRRKALIDAGASTEDISRDEENEGDALMAMGRVFSGTLHGGRPYYAISHRHNPLELIPRVESDPLAVSLVDVNSVVPVESGQIGLYLCFGPSFKAVGSMPAGNIVGIIGLERYILKTGTLSSSFYCPPMRAITFQAKPILRVAVEPRRHQDLGALERGLRGLYQYDPVVEVAMEPTGQYTISCLGELHLELCLKALRERFAKYVWFCIYSFNSSNFLFVRQKM